MSYVVIARKYRPTRFDEVIGQEAVAETLKNSIAQNRVHHAYLFTGPRGVGKTSMARIFSKALIYGDKDLKSDDLKKNAQEILEGRSLDVIEIDGASNRGIDDVREIRENVKFSPSNGKYKIYIIDEVHQITTDAFNALLKTLEEPPAHAKFIFATTSPQKVPATILSRCQRFDFRSIPTARIADVLEAVAKQEKIKIDRDGILELAKAADGSLRDGQSLLDQIGSFKKDKIKGEDVAKALGFFQQSELVELFASIAQADAPSVIQIADRVIQSGKDPAFFIEKCAEHVRNLMIINTVKKPEAWDEFQDSYRQSLIDQVKFFSNQDLFYIFSVLTSGLNQLRRFRMTRIAVEMVLLKCTLREPMALFGMGDKASPTPSVNPIKAPSKPKVTESASSSTSAKPSKMPKGMAVKGSQALSKDMPPANSDLDSTVEVAEITSTQSAPAKDMSAKLAVASSEPEPETEKPSDSVQAGEKDLNRVWPKFVNRISQERMSVATYLGEAQPVGIEGSEAVVRFKAGSEFIMDSLTTNDNLMLLQKHLSEILEKEVRIRFVIHGSAPEQDAEQEQSPIVKQAAGIFGGRIIKR